MGQRDPVRVGRVGEEGDLYSVDVLHHDVVLLRFGGWEGAGVRDPVAVESLAGVDDAGLALVERVVRGRVAHVPARGLDPLGEGWRRVEDRIARRRRRGHRRLYVTDPER